MDIDFWDNSGWGVFQVEYDEWKRTILWGPWKQAPSLEVLSESRLRYVFFENGLNIKNL